MRRIFLIPMERFLLGLAIGTSVICSDISFARADNQAAAEKMIGSNVETFSSLADRTMKGAITFFAVILLATHVLKRVKGTQSQNSGKDDIQIVNRKAIGNRASLLLIRVRNKELLVGSSGENLTLLSEFHSGPHFADIFSDSCEEFDNAKSVNA